MYDKCFRCGKLYEISCPQIIVSSSPYIHFCPSCYENIISNLVNELSKLNYNPNKLSEILGMKIEDNGGFQSFSTKETLDDEIYRLWKTGAFQSKMDLEKYLMENHKNYDKTQICSHVCKILSKI